MFSKSIFGEILKSKTLSLRKRSIYSTYFLDIALNGTVEQSHFRIKKVDDSMSKEEIT